MVTWGDTGLFNLVFLAQNLFISSFALVPMGTTLQDRETLKLLSKFLTQNILTNIYTDTQTVMFMQISQIQEAALQIV